MYLPLKSLLTHTYIENEYKHILCWNQKITKASSFWCIWGIVERFSIYMSAKSNERRNYICYICLHWLKTLLYIKSCFLFGVPILLPDSISCGEAPGAGFDVKGTSQIAAEPWMITWPTGILSATQNWDLWYILQKYIQVFIVHFIAPINWGCLC